MTASIEQIRERLARSEGESRIAYKPSHTSHEADIRTLLAEIDRLTVAIRAPTTAAYQVAAFYARRAQPTIHAPEAGKVGEAVAQAFDALAEIAGETP